MSKYIYYILILLLIIVIFINAYIKTEREGFIPKINQIYNPIKRRLRVNYEGMYNHVSKHSSNIFRRVGLI